MGGRVEEWGTTPQLGIEEQVIVLGDMIHQNTGASLYTKQECVYVKQ